MLIDNREIDDMNGDNEQIKKDEGVPKILSAIGSPLKLFGLVIIFSNTVFGVAAAKMNDGANFKYSIHMFLAIVGAIVLIALWSPRSLYHPAELKNVPDNKMPKENPKVASLILCGALAAYMIYYTINH
jgi:hypothetical protein